MQVTFKTNHGYKERIICFSGKTIGNLLRYYLYEIDEIFCYNFTFLENFNLFTRFIKQIQFFYNGQQINWYIEGSFNNDITFSETTISDYFKNDNNPEIFVNDINNLFLINWYEKKHIIFKTNHGYKNEFNVNNICLLNEMIINYLRTIGH